jgi:beta-N-acetylhexosaminidase
MVRHIKGASSQTPGNMAIGATGRAEDARLSGFYIGRELAAMGVNMNFAPVVDLATRPDSFVIGPRAFSDDPAKVALLGSAFARGLADAGIVATAKHFPGHGDTLTDSHGRLPVIAVDEKLLRARELPPFAALIQDGVPAVMAGHLSFPAIEPGGLPSSLSARFMTDILRSELGFKGLAITDDLYMQGAGKGGEGAKARQAFEAGNDMIMLSRLVEWGDSLWSTLVAACGSEPRFRARLEEAVARILGVKLRYLKYFKVAPLVPDPRSVPALVPDREAAIFFRDLARRAATLISGGDVLPVKPGLGIVIAAPFQDFLNLALGYYPGAEAFSFSYRPLDAAKPGELAAFRRAISGARSVIVCVANRAGADFAREASLSGAKLAVLSVDSPVWASDIPASAALVAVYSDTVPSLLAGLDVISGRALAPGILPIHSGTLPSLANPAGKAPKP